MIFRVFLFVVIVLPSLFSFSQQRVIKEVKLEGVKKIDTVFLRKILQTKRGAYLDSITLKNDITFLKRLPAVSNASYKVSITSGNFCTVLLKIEENYTIIPTINFWTTTHKRFAYKLGVAEYNFLGKNIALGGFYQNNGFHSYGLNLKAPNLFSRQWGLAVNYQNWKSEEPLYFDTETANYLYQNISFEVLGLYQIDLKNNVQFGVNFFNEKYQYVSGILTASIPKKLNLDKTLFKGVYTYDALQYDYQYTEGFKSVLYTQMVRSKNSFFIAWNDFFYYKRIGEKSNWANRLRLGLSSNENTPFAPFALDNNVNLRGVGILVDRGTGSIVWNTEYRHTIYDQKNFIVQTNVFSDVGSWRKPGGSLKDFYQQENIQMYSGVGVRFSSKKVYNAVFRIDYGFRITDNPTESKGGVVFGIGQYF